MVTMHPGNSSLRLRPHLAPHRVAIRTPSPSRFHVGFGAVGEHSLTPPVALHPCSTQLQQVVLPHFVQFSPWKVAPQARPRESDSPCSTRASSVPSGASSESGLTGSHRSSCKPRRSRRRTVPSRIASILEQLDDVDPAQILIVKKIHRLGYSAAEQLKQHLLEFGGADRVFPANPPDVPVEAGMRMRPSGMAFVVMGSAEGAAAVLRAGDEQAVANSTVVFSPFTRQDD